MVETGAGFSVVICVYTEERWADIEAAIGSVRSQEPSPHEVIVVVDHNPALEERIRRDHHDVTVVPNSGQQGLSDARNSGVRVASGAIVAFLDDDARAEPGWLAAIAQPYARPEVIGVGGSADPVWPEGGRPSWFPQEFDWVVGCSYRGLPERAAPIRNFLGCNMSFRRSAFEEAGGFDTKVGRVGTRPVGGEETEFCIRVQRIAPDAVLWYEPAASVKHRVTRTRASWSYYRARCYAEGLSKAIVTDLAGSRSGLASERRHAMVTLPLGALRQIGSSVVRRDLGGVRRAGAIFAGLAVTTAGYIVGRWQARRGPRAEAGETS